jgi:hypothetical protein
MMKAHQNNDKRQRETEAQELESYFDQKEQKYMGSLLFWLHLLFGAALLWVGVALPAQSAWLGILVYMGIFAWSIRIYQKGHSGQAIFLTVGSLFLGAFLLIASCFSLLSGMR